MKYRAPNNPWSNYPLNDIQANILQPNGRQHTRLIFIRFSKRKANRKTIRDWLKVFITNTSVSSAAEQYYSKIARRHRKVKPDGGTVTNLFVAKSFFDIPDLNLPVPKDLYFQQGMHSAFSRKQIGDPVPSDWQKNYRKPVHILIALADSDPTLLDTRVQAVINNTYFSDPGADIFVEQGKRLFFNQKEVEHFGYRDGISQIKFWSDEMTLHADRAGIALVPEGQNRFGSYLVFRKLEQNVRAFYENLRQLSHTTGIEQEALGAQLIGRDRNGKPLAVGSAYNEFANNNNFDYAQDPDGRVCPLHAHIRKANPRNASTYANRRLIIRRGIAYGERKADLTDRPVRGRGLLFMCFQASITNQYAYLQRNHLNSPDMIDENATSPRETGIDPIGGGVKNRSVPQTWIDPIREVQNRCAFQGNNIVKFKGGDYFYAPSISAIYAFAGMPIDSFRSNTEPNFTDQKQNRYIQN